MGVVRWLNLLILFLDSFNRCGVNLTRTYQLSISGPGVCFGTISVSVITPFPRATIVGAPEEDKFIEVASVVGAFTGKTTNSSWHFDNRKYPNLLFKPCATMS